ncbi:hypothetical protein PCC7424_3981 [Gloeothece citriformis PCC 7424]|uniref:Uncharacterized protein n=1 Tax=Gloeothece citriformis (strain PCC 7424) TaxID=65393 RepID=B7KKM2_GLOC7|nr:hypothetical protein [Gloeothece citriformis]ACK72355.1 hypothetical protein PCC7424_3981 [Gloeothece citriformis PCC 7424]
MPKNIVLFLVASGSFSLAMLMANSSQANPTLSEKKEGVMFDTPVLSNLNVISPSLNWNHNQDNGICHSAGCGCGSCIRPSTSSLDS